MDYKVVVAGFPSDLEKKVKELIGQGWKPTGGVAVGETASTNGQLYQAMVKPE